MSWTVSICGYTMIGWLKHHFYAFPTRIECDLELWVQIAPFSLFCFLSWCLITTRKEMDTQGSACVCLPALGLQAHITRPGFSFNTDFRNQICILMLLQQAFYHMSQHSSSQVLPLQGRMETVLMSRKAACGRLMGASGWDSTSTTLVPGILQRDSIHSLLSLKLVGILGHVWS